MACDDVDGALEEELAERGLGDPDEPADLDEADAALGDEPPRETGRGAERLVQADQLGGGREESNPWDV